MAKNKFDLSTPDGRKEALQRIITDWGVGKATASDARNALQLLMKIEGDIKDVGAETLKADPYSVMKVFLRAEGLSAIETLRENLSDAQVAQGVAKVLNAKKIAIMFEDGGVGKYVKTLTEEKTERSEKQEENHAIQAERVECEGNVQDDAPEEGADGVESEQEEGKST